MTISKSEADKLQAKVKAKGGSLDALGSTLGHKVRVKATKPKKSPQNADNWIGSEDDFQIAVARLLDASGLYWFHCPNGGSRNAREGAKLKKMGVKAGVPDIIILDTTKDLGKGLCIELKVGKNTVTNHQKYFATVFYLTKWRYEVCYSMSSVQKLLKLHYGIKIN
jgi:hypothetical protein